MILAQLGLDIADQWCHCFFTMILLTHWILLYATPTAFLPLSKINKKKGLRGWMTWFSTVLCEPAIGYATLFGLQSLGGITSVIQQEGSGSGTNQWLAYDLLDAYELLELDLESRTGSRYQQGIPDFQLGFQQE